MMDPFEARLQFQQMLKTITSSNNNNTVIVNFLLANAELQEDFHSCILEALQVNEINYKVNVFQLVEVIVQRSLAVSGVGADIPYVKNIVRDLDVIVGFVLSLNGEKYVPVNLSSTYTILEKISKLLQYKNLGQRQRQYRHIDVTGAEDSVIVELKPIENRGDKQEVLDCVWELVLQIKKKSKLERIRREEQTQSIAEHEDGGVYSGNGNSTDTDTRSKNVLRRLEDDRERTKRLKETLWEVVDGSGVMNDTTLRQEFHEIQSKYPVTRQDDFKDMVELNGIVGQCYNDWGSSTNPARKQTYT